MQAHFHGRTYGLKIVRAAIAAVRDVVPRNLPVATVHPSLGVKHLPQIAAPRNTAPHNPSRPRETNPRRPLEPRQLTAARLLLAGASVAETARQLRVHRYTVSRWKVDPRFQAELRRQVAASAAPRNGAPQTATLLRAPALNEPTAGPREPAGRGT
jgi:hypothetical protein